MALEFDGSSQYIQVTQNSGLPIYDDTTYSICGWVKAPAQDDKRIFSEGQTGSNNTLLTIGSGRTADEKTDKVFVLIRTDANAVLLNVYSTTTVFDSTWHHFCWVDNNGDADLYIDGILDATNFNYTRSGTFTMNRTGIAAVIRAEVSNWLDGELFDIRCYNRCLTPNEISEIYHKRGADRIWEGLVGQWRLDELPDGSIAPILLDSMDATTGWNDPNGGTITLNNTTYYEGTGALNDAISDKTYALLRKAMDLALTTDTTVNVYVYIKDNTVLNKLSNLQPTLWTELGKSYYYFQVLRADLVTGWNKLSKKISDMNTSGSPSAGNITYLDLRINFDGTQSISAGDVITDFFHTEGYIPGFIRDLSGNGNHGTPYNSPVYQASPHRLRRGVLVS